MGTSKPMRLFKAYRNRRKLPPLSGAAGGGRPRDYEEWRTLRRWGMLPEWEPESPGYLLRDARERAGLTQAALAGRLGTSQQAVAAAERWDANPTVAFLRRWARACGQDVDLVFSPGKEKTPR
jgi:DNA-binding XRE family transcriptional regulator